MSQLTIEALKPTKEQIDACEKVFLCMAVVDTIKPIVEGYQREILKKHQWSTDQEFMHGLYEDKVILDPEKTHLLGEADFKVFLKEVHVEHLKHGFDVPMDYCPLLIAKAKLVDAERNLINIYEKVTGISYDQVSMRLDTRKKYLDLILSFLAKHMHTKKILKNEQNIMNEWFKKMEVAS